ncbi:MAG: hypothetical protein IJ062_13090 [Firmicutes bacterium]|nr:hypothetical protein [Bacillota bacterium]
MKKIISLLLAAVISVGGINTVFADNYTDGAAVSVQAETPVISLYGGWHESFYVNWDNDNDAKNAKVFYKESGETDYTQADSELVRATANGGRVDIVGIKAGYYDVKIETAGGTVLEQSNIPVDNFDRSGYAHFNTNIGVGAYNNDGTPKDGAVILYVDNDNKNTITYNGKTGIGNILNSANNIKVPLIVRFIGTVDTQTRDADGTKTTDKKNGVVAINGLTDRDMGNDSYFNMLDVKNASNITIEGIGTDAVIEKWGFTFSVCQNIEARNLTFTKYPEDACSFLGSGSNFGAHFWLHNCTFEIGENKYDLTSEQDKHEGDGSTDVARANYVTFSYNRFNNCHKTSLNGNGNDVKQYHITWHHNYFENVSSRMPLVRQANVHTYNNYFHNCGTCVDVRASAWVLSEANYFEDIETAAIISRVTSSGAPVIKSYNDVFVNAPKVDAVGDAIHTAASRDETYTAPSDNSNPYPNFDTNSSVFYYKNGKSNVELLESAEAAKENCIKNSGVMTGGGDIPVVPPVKETTTETTTIVTEVQTGTPEAGKTPASDTGDASLNTVTYRAATDDYYLLDRSSTATTIWRVPFEKQTSGVIVVRGSVTPQVAASKWALVQVRGNTSAGVEDTIASLATDPNSVLSLRSGAESYAQTAHSISANIKYDYELVIDLDNKTVSLVLDGEPRVSLAADVTDVSSVYFMTAQKAADRDIAVTMPSVLKVIENTKTFLYGDVTADGLLAADDAAMLLQKVLTEDTVMPIEKETDDWLKYADVSGEGQLEAADATLILQRVLSDNMKFPVEQ